MNIPMVDLYAQYLMIKNEIDNAIASVIKKSSFIGGEYVEKLEQEITKYCGTKYAVALNSGTDALFLALEALDIGDGDEVITTPFTFFATAEVIVRLGAKPVFVDIDPDTFNIDAELIEEKITKKTKAIIPVHLFGLPAEMDKIMKITRKYKLYVIEDACQAIGAVYKGKKTGSIGDVGCFSFFPSKNLGAYGDGGMITTNNRQVAETVRMLRNHGSKVKYFNEFIGYSSRLDSIQAAILLVKLKYLDRWNKKRNRIATEYNRLLQNIKWITLPNLNNMTIQQYNNCSHIFHQYTIRVKNGKRDQLKQHLKDRGISSMIYYPIPLHLLPPLKCLGFKKNDFFEAEKAASEVLSLPIYPELENKNIKYIIKTIKTF